jgi:hypothetical protein
VVLFSIGTAILKLENKMIAHVDFLHRQKALAEFLEFDEREIDDIRESSYNEQMLTVGDKEYYVVTDEEADDLYYEQQMGLIDDIGLEGFTENFQQTIVNNFIGDRFWDDLMSDVTEWVSESPESYLSFFDIDNIRDKIWSKVEDDYHLVETLDINADRDDYDSLDDFLSDVKDEIDEWDDEVVIEQYQLIDYLDDEAYEAAQKYLESYDSPIDFLEELGYSGAELNNQLGPYIDWDEVIEECKSWDGRGHTLSAYDGEEHEVDVDGETFFIYRWN